MPAQKGEDDPAVAAAKQEAERSGAAASQGTRSFYRVTVTVPPHCSDFCYHSLLAAPPCMWVAKNASSWPRGGVTQMVLCACPVVHL